MSTETDVSSAPIARVANLDVAAFRTRFEEPGIPVILEGGARDQAAVARWNAAYLGNKLGAAVLPWKLSSTHKHPNFRASTIPEMFARESGTFASLLEKLTTGTPEERSRRLFTGDEQFLLRRRNGETTTDPVLAPLLDDFSMPAFVPAERLYTVWAWFSGPGVRTWLHYDNNGCHNLNAQLTGEKECVLYAPDDLARLEPFVLGAGNPATNCSRIDVEEPPPELASVPSFHGVIRAGDLLFLPAWWWHTFRHHGELNANVNVWWKPTAERTSATSRRQGWLDLVTQSKLDTRDPSTAAILRRLDEAAIGAAPG